jgi:hypothetical protein
VARHLIRLFTPMPPQLRQTVTFDNGSEFAGHGRLHKLAIDTYFCDPYSPWQKGSVENAIGRLRRFLPRKTDLASLPDKHFKALVSAYNNTPRKCLDFKTPAEAFCEVLHFECESTSPLSRGRADSALPHQKLSNKIHLRVEHLLTVLRAATLRLRGGEQRRHQRHGDDVGDEHVAVQPRDIDRQWVARLHAGRRRVDHQIEA